MGSLGKIWSGSRKLTLVTKGEEDQMEFTNFLIWGHFLFEACRGVVNPNWQAASRSPHVVLPKPGVEEADKGGGQANPSHGGQDPQPPPPLSHEVVLTHSTPAFLAISPLSWILSVKKQTQENSFILSMSSDKRNTHKEKRTNTQRSM